MGIRVNIGEAKARLSELVAASLRGEEVLLSRAGKPVARILALDDASDAENDRLIAERQKQWTAWVGSFAGQFPANAGEEVAGATYTDQELNSFSPGDLNMYLLETTVPI